MDQNIQKKTFPGMWWQWTLMDPTPGISLLGAVPTYPNVAKSYLIELTRRFGLLAASVLVVGLVAAIWGIAQWTAQAGQKVSVLWDMVKYTKDNPSNLKSDHSISAKQWMDKIEKASGDESVLSLSQAILTSLRTQEKHFRVFEFKLYSVVRRVDLARDGLPFDLVLNGFLKMRSDDPANLIRTNYDVSLLVKIVPEGLTASHVEQVVSGGEKVLRLGIDVKNHGHFEPWDTHVFLAGRNFKEPLPILHSPYINLYMLTQDDGYHNASPHHWMDEVLRRIQLKWQSLGGKRQGTNRA